MTDDCILKPDLNQHELDDFGIDIDIYEEEDDFEDDYEDCTVDICGHCGEGIVKIDEIEDVEWDEVKQQFYGFHVDVWVHRNTEQKICRSGKTGAYPRCRMTAG